MKDKISAIAQFILYTLKGIWLLNVIVRLYNKAKQNTFLLVLSIICVSLISIQGYQLYSKFLEIYTELNTKIAESDAEKDPGLAFTQIDDGLYTLTGSVQAGDCERIVPQMPQNFTVILESPGGNLAEGSCLAAHIKLRNVITVVRATPVYNDLGKEIYTPGAVTAKISETFEGKTMCASACGIMFLGGDKRYLIGNVWFGIHGPGTPAEFIGSMSPQQLESGSFRTAANLLKLLEQLGVEDPELRRLFIQIPNQSMYWLRPEDFDAKPSLASLATNYKNFWGLTTNSLEAGTE